MHTRLLLLLNIGAALAAGCSRTPPAKKKDFPLQRIVFASGGCLGSCPYTATEVDSSGLFHHYGGLNSDTLGYFTGKLSDSLWIDLNQRLEGTGYRRLDTSYPRSVNEMPIEIILYYDNGSRKRIFGSYDSYPDSVQRFLRWMMELPREVRMKKSDSVHFETKAQFPPPPPKLYETGHFFPPFNADDLNPQNKKNEQR